MKRLAPVCLLALLSLLALAAGSSMAGDAAAPATGDAAARLHDLFSREWEFRLQASPLFATSTGRHDYDDRLPSADPAELARQADATRGFLAELAAIDPAGLDEQDRINYRIFKRQLEGRVSEYEFGADEIPIVSDSGFHTEFSRLPEEVPLATVRDYENYLARLAAFPRWMGEEIAQMRRGLARGMTQPRVILNGFEVTIDTHVVDKVEDSVFYQPFEHFPAGVPEADRARLAAAGRAAVMEKVVPAYAEFSRFMKEEYVPGARTTLGASELPRGREYYAYLVERFTTLPVSAEEVHAIGLREVARIEGEMKAVIDQVGFKGSFADFLTFLRTDPRFYAKTPEELLARAALIAKRMDGKLPSLFGHLPRLPYGIAPVPADLAPKYTGGRYVPAPKGSTRAGTYWVNTYDLPSRPFYTLESLTLHEAVPGHHLQIALNQELSDLPPFRQFSYLSAFGEGWGLYSEWLGLEAGFYTDPYSNFGRLSYEMWRACRLVVDTGLHAMGWTRQQAMDYLASHTALSLHEVETETDRYISWPGQALAYKMGELKIKELRHRAEEELGPRFDVRAFHDAVLANGSVPLPVLEEVIDAYIARAKE
jgi:uncharacterized protein (DUF885 family)